MGVVLVKNAERMMTSAELQVEGIEINFADGRSGLIPFAEIPGVDAGKKLANVELPNPYEAVLHTTSGETFELPWDFARHYCDSSYRLRVEEGALAGRQAIGDGIRRLRKIAGLTQKSLANGANIGRVTLVRIENGEQSPRYETIVALAQALRRPIQHLLVSEHDAHENVVLAQGQPGKNEAEYKPIQISGEDLSDAVYRERR